LFLQTVEGERASTRLAGSAQPLAPAYSYRLSAMRLRCRSRRRSASVLPPHTPAGPFANAHLKQLEVTAQDAQMVFARAIWSWA
jgi:hypothetical protein